MKACIVTFQSAYNYGAILQAYALQQHINNNFCDAVVLNYNPSYMKPSYGMPNFDDFKKNPLGSTIKFIQYYLYEGKRNKIEDFRKYIRLTESYDENTIKDASDIADIYIAGSDQIWNYQIIGNDGTFFLDFVKDNKKTCSYAASFGVNMIPNEKIEFYKEKLKRINYLSVREEIGCQIIDQLINRKSCTVLDPVMLLRKSEWERLCIKNEFKKPYILVYKITKADQLINFAIRLAKLTGFDIVYVPNDIKSGFIGKTLFNIGPEDWLSLIKNANYVVTNSFHGAVFSILFHKKFFVEASPNVNSSTSRLDDLLETFNLEHLKIEKFNSSLLNGKINISNIDDVLETERNISAEFLNSVLT